MTIHHRVFLMAWVMPRWVLMGLAAATLTACNSDSKTNSNPTPTPTPPVVDRAKLTGEELFKTPFPGAKNQRTCASCHVPEDNFTLSPEHVEKLWASNPKDPLFSAIDADDPTAATLTFDHLKKGLIRVWLTLPKNVDVIDAKGEVMTAANRKVFVWRSVPPIADVVLTPPYQLDGRVATLEEQAQGAVEGHSEGGIIPKLELTRMADFERDIFSSNRARKVDDQLALGIAPKDVTDVDAELELTEEEKRGQEIYEKVCAACHGGVNKATIVDRDVHDLAFPELLTTGETPAPIVIDNSKNEFINIGSSFETYLSVIDATEHKSFTTGVSYPQYRLRFYTDATRTKTLIDLPEATDFALDTGDGPGDPSGGDPNEGDDTTAPIIKVPQLFSTDPGRALITGNPYDFEAFDVPTLRGISKTAPYWHDNITESLEKVIDLYSDHMLVKFPTLILEGEKEPDDDGDIGGLAGEALTKQHKTDLLAYLKKL